jgi:hypothetical protein
MLGEGLVRRAPAIGQFTGATQPFGQPACLLPAACCQPLATERAANNVADGVFRFRMSNENQSHTGLCS